MSTETQPHPSLSVLMLENALVIGVDIGGTKVAAGLVTTTGEIQKQVRVPMESRSGPEAGLASVLAAIDLLLASEPGRSSARAIGICSPGPLDPQTGVVINPGNLPCWRNFPLAKEVASHYSLPVKVDNDANAAALAEARWGAGRSYRNIFYATIGTGIGTGIIFNGCIYHGRTGAAAEGGHMSIDYRGPLCNCGKPGCIEVFAAGPAIARRAREKLIANPERSPALRALAGGDVSKITGEIVGAANAAGDELAKETLQETADFLSLWFGNAIDMLEPDVMIIGGGAGALLAPFMDYMRKRIPDFAINSRAAEIPLLNARYGPDSGIAGGAALCLDPA